MLVTFTKIVEYVFTIAPIFSLAWHVTAACRLPSEAR